MQRAAEKIVRNIRRGTQLCLTNDGSSKFSPRYLDTALPQDYDQDYNCLPQVPGTLFML